MAADLWWWWWVHTDSCGYNEGSNDKLPIIITTSALTNVSFTACCLDLGSAVKNTEGGGSCHLFEALFQTM